MSKKANFRVTRPWYGVTKGQIVELAVTDAGTLENPVLAPNVEPAPEAEAQAGKPKVPVVPK